MKIVDGRWVTEDNSPIDPMNKELKELSEKVTAVYGKDITHDRISIIAKLPTLKEHQEQVLSRLLNDEELFSKLIGE